MTPTVWGLLISKPCLVSGSLPPNSFCGLNASGWSNHPGFNGFAVRPMHWHSYLRSWKGNSTEMSLFCIIFWPCCSVWTSWEIPVFWGILKSYCCSARKCLHAMCLPYVAKFSRTIRSRISRIHVSRRGVLRRLIRLLVIQILVTLWWTQHSNGKWP